MRRVSGVRAPNGVGSPRESSDAGLSERPHMSAQAQSTEASSVLDGSDRAGRSTTSSNNYASSTVLQASELRGMLQATELKEEARAGLSGPSQVLPHLDTVQKAFAGHDLSGVRAVVGGSAQKSSERMGARAFTCGESVGFESAPDVRTVAHEAAHVVQQRSGVSVPEGIGRRGDRYEQNADAVAEQVAKGQPAGDLLGGGGDAGARSKETGLQFDDKSESCEAPTVDSAGADGDKSSSERKPLLSDLGKGETDPKGKSLAPKGKTLVPFPEERVRKAIMQKNAAAIEAAVAGFESSRWPKDLLRAAKQGRRDLNQYITNVRALGLLAPTLVGSYSMSKWGKNQNIETAKHLIKFAAIVTREFKAQPGGDGVALAASVCGPTFRALSSKLLFAVNSVATIKAGDQKTTEEACLRIKLALADGVKLYQNLPLHLQVSGGFEALYKTRDWADDRADLIEQLRFPDAPVLIPFFGILFYSPFREGLFNTVVEVKEFAQNNTAVLLGPIIIPVLSAWHIAIEPHKVIDITRAKIEVIMKLADPSLSDGEKWKHILNLAGDRLIDIGFSKMVKVPTTGNPYELAKSQGTANGLGRFMAQNRQALTLNFLTAILKDHSKDLKKQALGLSSPEEVWTKFPKNVQKRVFKDVIGAVFKGASISDHTLDWFVKFMLEGTAGQLDNKQLKELDAIVDAKMG